MTKEERVEKFIEENKFQYTPEMVKHVKKNRFHDKVNGLAYLAILPVVILLLCNPVAEAIFKF